VKSAADKPSWTMACHKNKPRRKKERTNQLFSTGHLKNCKESNGQKKEKQLKYMGRRRQ